jgi:hypothetical protein
LRLKNEGYNTQKYQISEKQDTKSGTGIQTVVPEILDAWGNDG